MKTAEDFLKNYLDEESYPGSDYEFTKDELTDMLKEYASQISEEEIEEEARLEANRSQFMSNFPHCWRSVYAGFLACAKWYKQQLNK